MPVYSVSLCTAAGQEYRTKIDAPSVAAMRSIVESRREFLLKFRELEKSTAAFRLRLPARIVQQLFNLLHMQLGGGVLTEVALARLKDEFPDRNARTILRTIHARLAGAERTLSEAMAEFPRTFPESIIATVRVGETTGVKALSQRFADLRDQIAFRTKIGKLAKKALAYPVFVTLCAAGVLSFLFVKLIPRLKDLLLTLNADLPGATIAVLSASDFLVTTWPVFGAMFVGLIMLLTIGRRVRRVAFLVDRFALRIPGIGGILRALITAEICKNYASLYQAGEPAGPTLAACASIVKNRAVRAALLRARTLLETGELTRGKEHALPITEALRSVGYMPGLALTIIGTGEESGAIDTAMHSVSKHYAEEAQELITTFFAVFDKALLLLVIGITLLVAVAIYQPIMTTIGSLLN